MTHMAIYRMHTHVQSVDALAATLTAGAHAWQVNANMDAVRKLCVYPSPVDTQVVCTVH